MTVLSKVDEFLGVILQYKLVLGIDLEPLTNHPLIQPMYGQTGVDKAIWAFFGVIYLFYCDFKNLILRGRQVGAYRTRVFVFYSGLWFFPVEALLICL